MIFRSKVPTLLTMGSTQPLRPEGVSKERKKERKKKKMMMMIMMMVILTVLRTIIYLQFGRFVWFSAVGEALVYW